MRRSVLWLGCYLAASMALAQDATPDPAEGTPPDTGRDAEFVSGTGDELGLITLAPGETYKWILDYSVRADPGAPCPEIGRALALHALSSEALWGCKAITNSGALPGIWRVDFNTTAGDGVNLYLDQGEERRRILTAQSGRTMADTKGPWLASETFAIAPGETVVLWTELSAWKALRVDPFLSWAHLVPEAEFDTGTTERGFAIATLLTASGLLILFLATFARLLGSTPARDYAIYFTVATANFVFAEGYLSWLFTSLPVFWAVLPAKPLEVAIFVLYYRFIASFTRTALGDHPLVGWYKRVAWSVVIIFLVNLVLFSTGTMLMTMPDDVLIYMGDRVPLPDWTFDVASWVVFSSQRVGWFLMGVISAAYAIWAIIALLRARADGAVLFTLGVSVILVLYFLPYFREVLGLAGYQGFMLTRGMIVADGLVFAAALIQQTFGLRAQRDAALQAELQASQEKLALAENLLAAKEGRAHAEALAERHRERLALTSHDLRQPLTSLRLAVSDAEQAAPGLGDKLGSAVDYLRQVLDDTVVEARPEDLHPQDSSTSDYEPVPVALLLQNVDRMFGDEARSKGLDFAVVPSDLVVASQPVALIRILSNLVSNAVKYTEHGRIEIATHVVGEHVSLSVADTGPGLTPQERKDILQSYNRGEAKDDVGEGIGLTSVLQLTEELGLGLEISGEKGTGATFTVTGLRQAVLTE